MVNAQLLQLEGPREQDAKTSYRLAARICQSQIWPMTSRKNTQRILKFNTKHRTNKTQAISLEHRQRTWTDMSPRGGADGTEACGKTSSTLAIRSVTVTHKETSLHTCRNGWNQHTAATPQGVWGGSQGTTGNGKHCVCLLHNWTCKHHMNQQVHSGPCLPREMSTYDCTNTHTWLFIAALSVTAKNRSSPEALSGRRAKRTVGQPGQGTPVSRKTQPKHRQTRGLLHNNLGDSTETRTGWKSLDPKVTKRVILFPYITSFKWD